MVFDPLPCVMHAHLKLAPDWGNLDMAPLERALLTRGLRRELQKDSWPPFEKTELSNKCASTSPSLPSQRSRRNDGTKYFIQSTMAQNIYPSGGYTYLSHVRLHVTIQRGHCTTPSTRHHSLSQRAHDIGKDKGDRDFCTEGRRDDRRLAR